MIGCPEQRGRRAHVVRGENDRCAVAKTDMPNKCSKLFGERASVVTDGTCRLVGIAIAPHVGHKHRVARFGQSRHHLSPLLAGAEETMPQKDWLTVWIATESVVNASPAYDGHFACEAWNLVA